MPGWDCSEVIAHRCGGALAPENTLAGLVVAARLGCRAVEFDVMLSGDGVPVLIHDETLVRTAGRPGQVSRLTARELAAVDVGCRFHPAYAGETIPTLQAALASCRALGLAANVEIKPAAGCEQRTGQVVGRYLQEAAPELLPQVLLSSFSVEALTAAISESPTTPRALLVEHYAPEAVEVARALSCAALNLSRAGLCAAHVDAVRAAGLQVLVYTVNLFEEARQLVGWGVSGVFSDRPERLLSAFCKSCNT